MRLKSVRLVAFLLTLLVGVASARLLDAAGRAAPAGPFAAHEVERCSQ